MTDLTTAFAAPDGSHRFHYDANSHLFYYAEGGSLKSFDPVSGAVSTVLTVSGTIGDFGLTPDGSQFLIGMQDVIPNDNPYLQRGTLYQVPVATAGDVDTWDTRIFYAGFTSSGTNDLAVTADGQVLMSVGPLGNYLDLTFRADGSGEIPYDFNLHVNGSDFVTSEHGRYVLVESDFSSDGEFQLYDTQVHDVVATGSAFTYNRGRGDVSEAAGRVIMFTYAGLSMYDLALQSVGSFALPDYPHMILDAKFNVGGHQFLLWDGLTGEIDVYDTQSLALIGSAQADATNQDEIAYTSGSRMELSSDGHFLLLQTATGYESVDLFSRLQTSQTGTAETDVIYGTQGRDMIDGGAGADVMAGGQGDDTYIVDDAGDKVVEAWGEGTDTVLASVSFDSTNLSIERITLTGSDNINAIGNSKGDLLIGNAGDNWLYGMAGNDKLDGRGGNDTLVGGVGNDTYYVDGGSDQVVENAGEGTDTVNASASYSLGDNVENLILTGASGTTGTGNGLANTLTGNAHDNQLMGLGGNDSLFGMAGNDTLDGGLGADAMAGGTGNDIYYVDNIHDTVTELGGQGTDTVYASVSFFAGSQSIENIVLTGSGDINAGGSAGANTLTGNSGDNVLRGGAGNDTLTGNDGDDTLDGGAGKDAMAGGDGDDIYYVDNFQDVVTETQNGGKDIVYASASFNLSLNGQWVEDLMLTGTGNINGTGDGQNNYIVGNSGNNVLNGMGGDDYLVGRGGADTFLFTAGSGHDQIQSFDSENGDSIDLHAYSHGTVHADWITVSGFNVVITMDANDSITVLKAKLGDVSAHIVW